MKKRERFIKTSISTSIILLFFIFPIILSAPPPPGELFDLTYWKLQLPVSNGNGSVMEVKQPALKTYTSEYFYTTSSDNSMTFWCPQDGATTPNSDNPRSELREMPANGDWTIKGKHEMNATVSVSQDPANHKVCIGQIHTDTDVGSCSAVVMLNWENGNLTTHFKDSSCKNIDKNVGTGIKLNTKFKYYIKMENGNATVITDYGTTTYEYTNIGSYNLYFKAGDYVQDSDPSSTEGGLIHFHALVVKHS